MVKLGFIGCGGINRHHARTIRAGVEGISIVAGADISADARNAFEKENPGTVFYDDYGKMLDEADIDAVCIGLPTGLHAAATIAAAKAGKHIFCEKPVGRSPEETARIEAAAREARVLTFVGYNYRWAPMVQYARELIQEGGLGPPLRVWCGGAPDEPCFFSRRAVCCRGSSKCASGQVVHGTFLNDMP